jgi:osmotically-inducible protein OsmY
MAQPANVIMKFRFGTVVIASDGEAGSVVGVVVQPGQRTVEGISVKLPGGTVNMVPLERIADAHADAVQLSITREALLQAMTATPADGTVFSRQTHVIVNGNSLGSLSQVSITTADHVLHRLAVKHGLGGETLVEAGGIREISDDGKQITCTVGASRKPIPYRPDSDLADAVHDALWNYPRLRVDMRAVNMRVIDGEVWLTGNVSNVLNRRVMSELLEDIEGLTAVHNELIADDELAIQISRALADDPRTHSQRLGVYPNLGTVYLRGTVTTPEAAQAVLEIATKANHTQQVVSQVLINGAATYIPMLAPVTGNEDVIPGGD